MGASGWFSSHKQTLSSTVALAAAICLSSCHTNAHQHETPTIPSGAVLQDRTFHSAVLGRDVTYRVIAPAVTPQRVHVIYLLHGNGGGFQDWSTNSSIAELATKGYVLVMPEGHGSYFMNAASKPEDRYEDFLTRDLIADAERSLPAVQRQDRAIVGVSMGGFAAIVLGFHHPELYGFVGALSPPVDAPERAFTVRRWGQSWALRSIFGPMSSETRHHDDPFLLAKQVDPAEMPFVFLGVGKQEPLFEPVSRFAAVLQRRAIPHQFQIVPGGHDWGEWQSQLPALETALEENGRG